MNRSLKGALATVAAAALLVVGVDYATFASTGDSLILGKFNNSTATTTIKQNSQGPALRLTTVGDKAPSLAVSSSARVSHLNASSLNGYWAADLATRTTTYKAGKRGDVIDGQGLWSIPVEPGVYHVSLQAFLFSGQQQGDPVPVICGVANNLDQQIPHVYAAGEALALGDGFPILISASETVRIKPTASPVLICTSITNGGELTLSQPIQTSWTKINHLRSEDADPVDVPQKAVHNLLHNIIK